MPLQALSSVNRCIKIALQMVNWLLAGKDIGQPRKRSLCDDVSQFTSENLKILKCRREIFTSIEAKPPLFSWEVSECSCLLYSQAEPLGSCRNRPPSSQPAGGFGDVSHRITHTGHQRSSVPSVRSDHLGMCKEWGQKWAPSFWKMPQRKEITIGLETVFLGSTNTIQGLPTSKIQGTFLICKN